MTRLTLIAPHCTCCTTPVSLTPRDDLGSNLAVCTATGQLYRPEGTSYVPTTLPQLTAVQAVERQPIDLSQAGYA